MSGEGGSRPIKSAYELALERLDSAGIERPREEAFSGEALEAIERARSKAEASLAELEILHRKKMRETTDREARGKQEEEYRAERSRIQARRDREIEKIRRAAAGD